MLYLGGFWSQNILIIHFLYQILVFFIEILDPTLVDEGDDVYLLCMFLQKNWTSFSRFSSWSSMNLAVVPFLHWIVIIITIMVFYKSSILVSSLHMFWFSHHDCLLPEELHEPPLHFKPDISRGVEEEGQKCQVERNPLKKTHLYKKKHFSPFLPDSMSCRQCSRSSRPGVNQPSISIQSNKGKWKSCE